MRNNALFGSAKSWRLRNLFLNDLFVLSVFSGLPITPELGYCRHSDSRARSSDGGERGKTRGDTRGHWNE